MHLEHTQKTLLFCTMRNIIYHFTSPNIVAYNIIHRYTAAFCTVAVLVLCD